MRGWIIGAALCVTACGSEAPPTQGQEAQEIVAQPRQDIVVNGPERVILAFGDSLFAGYNLAEAEGYPEVLEVMLRSRGINARVIDAGVSGDTTAAGLQRIGFVLDNTTQQIDLAIVELGGNDLLRRIAPAETRANLEGIVQQLQQRNLPVLLMGMRAPPNGGVQFQQAFDGIYPQLAEEYETALVPFFMEPLANNPGLLLDDRIHPTAEGVAAMAEAQIDQVVAALPAQ